MSDVHDSLARRPENAIDAADVVDGVLILKRHDGRELRIGDGSHGGAPSGGTSGNIPVKEVTEARGVELDDIGCLLFGNMMNPIIVLDAFTVGRGFTAGDTFWTFYLDVGNNFFDVSGGYYVQVWTAIPVADELMFVPGIYSFIPTYIEKRSDTGSAIFQAVTDVNNSSLQGGSSVVAADAYGNLSVYNAANGDSSLNHAVSNPVGAIGLQGMINEFGTWIGLVAGLDNAAQPVVTVSFHEGAQKLGFFGTSGVARPAHPTTIEEVIAGLTALGLFQ